jgi:two-component sensor histidine kinase
MRQEYPILDEALKAFAASQLRLLGNVSGVANGHETSLDRRAERVCRRLWIEWRETGGPLVALPKRSGYGTNLIRDLIPHEIGGAVDLAFTVEDVSCKIKLPPALQTNHDR